MPVTDETLREAAADGLLWVPHPPDTVTPVPVDGLLGWMSSVDDPIGQWVGGARLDAARVDQAIGEVTGFFGSQGAPFFWLVGPGATPADLSERLAAHDFPEVATLTAMARRDLPSAADVAPHVSIEPLTDDLRAGWVAAMADAYPVPEPYAELFAAAALWEPEGPVTLRAYGAYVDGDSSPAGVGILMTHAEQHVAVLAGAATAPEHRRQGVYRSLLGRRLADARAAGAEAAVLQASPDSVPMCEALGFHPTCEIAVHLWMPPD